MHTLERKKKKKDINQHWKNLTLSAAKMPVDTCHIWVLQATLSQWLIEAGRAPR